MTETQIFTPEIRSYSIPDLELLGALGLPAPRVGWDKIGACTVDEGRLEDAVHDFGEASSRIMREMCGGCIVREDCLAFPIMNHYELHGNYGNKSPQERIDLRRRGEQLLLLLELDSASLQQPHEGFFAA